MKIAVVTPYWRETPDVLARCRATVRAQTVAATHYLVADGEPQGFAGDEHTVHLVLPENVGNCGSTPRGLGAQLAFNDGHEVVAFLDADNWFEPDHLERAVARLERERLDVVFARRTIVFPDGEVLTAANPQDEQHVDTSCHVLSRRAAWLAAVWAMHPREFGAGEERLLLAAIHHLKLRTARLEAPTVWYESNWAHHYALAGKPPVQPMRQPARRVASHFDPQRYFQHTGIALPFPRAPAAEPVELKAPEQWRIAVITPTLDRLPEALRPCIASVAAQGEGVVHFLVGDDAQPGMADIPGVRHLRLPGTRKDGGNSARGLAAAYAFQLGFDAVAFLEAEAAYEPGHLRRVAAAMAEQGAALAVCGPQYALASTILIHRQAAHLGALWAQLPATPDANGNALRFLQQAAARKVAMVALPEAVVAAPPAPVAVNAAPRALKIAVVTPYWQETPEVLARCLATVRAQTVPVTHYLVADGNPQALTEDQSLVHLVLPQNAASYGATPRGLGAMLAFNDGCDVVAFLDADNWLQPDHLERAVAALERDGLDVVFARRTIVFPDGEVLAVPDPKDAGHVDTSCYVISRRAAFLAPAWAMYPREFGSGEDRVILAAIRQLQLRSAWLDVPTVWYESNWRYHYDLAGKQPVGTTRQPGRRVMTHFDPERYQRQTGIALPLPRAPQAEPLVKRPVEQWRVAVVTPYRGESLATLQRCAASVARQDGEVVHYLVSEAAHPTPSDIPGVVSLRLPGGREDFGNTARGTGAAYAFQLGFDAVLFLDASAELAPHWLDPACRALAHSSAAIAVPAADTRPGSGILISRRTAYLGPMWAQLPRSPSAERNIATYLEVAATRGATLVRVDPARKAKLPRDTRVDSVARG